MGDRKLYNAIFPIWFPMFLSPWLILVLSGNLLIDGTVIYLTLRFNNALLKPNKLMMLILIAWIIGFIADIIAVLFLFLVTVTYNLDPYRIWNDPETIIIYTVIIILAGSLIYLANRPLCRKFGLSPQVSHEVAKAMGVLTAPWMFLVPTSLFY